MVIYMKGISKIIKLKEKEFYFMLMGKDMKVIGKIIKKKEMEFIFIIMVIEKWLI